MKKILTLLLATVFIYCGCTKESSPVNTKVEDDTPVFTSSFEGPISKTFVDENHKLLWTADDRLTIFTTTYNQQYRFTGKTGDNSGSFEKISSGDFITGNQLEANYAVYPFSESNKIGNNNIISLTLPAKQQYSEKSFGIGANTMVAVTENSSDYFLPFKNLCGYLVIKLYGDGIVKTISLKGNNNEKIAGACNVNAIFGTAPEIEMSDDATDLIILDCGNGIKLGADKDNATEFWFCIPPTTFSKGFIVTATNSDGMRMIKSVSSSKTITRNVVSTMASVEAIFDTEPEFIQFDDANFKAYCVANFDTDGDGEISNEESLQVISISAGSMGIKSLKGIEHFKNLASLHCGENELKDIDISNNTSLVELFCVYNQLQTLDVSKNTQLDYLRCDNNQLQTLDVSKNTKIQRLYCRDNQLQTLDIGNNTSISELDCSSNQLQTLDVSKNTQLDYLHCDNNQLKTLDVSKNTRLEFLYCDNNQLQTLDVSKNTKLLKLCCSNNLLQTLNIGNNTSISELRCSSNQLQTLDVSKNTRLILLVCDNNQLQTLDVSKNTELFDFRCSNNLLQTLDIGNNTSLSVLVCSSNQLQTLDIGNNTSISMLSCSSNQLQTLDVSKNIRLEFLYCDNNQLQTLDVSKNTKLYQLYCHNNQLQTLDIGNTRLWELDCSSNQLQTLDVSTIKAKNIWLRCLYNPDLFEIWVSKEQSVDNFEYDPSITTIKYK